MTDNASNIPSSEAASKKTRVAAKPANKNTKKSRELILRIAGLVVAAIVVFGLLMAFNQNFRASVLQSKYETYTYTNSKNQKFSMLFYRGSSFGTGRVTNTTSIIGPKSDNGGVPLELTIVSYPTSNASAKAVTKELLQCSFSGTNYRHGSDIYVPAVKSDAYVCLSPNYADGNPGNDAILFSTSSTDYFIEVAQNFNADLAKTSKAYDKQIAPYLGLSASIQKDIKTIVGSIKPLQ
jgi:hypothetical protein